jgi:hypothetical protein
MRARRVVALCGAATTAAVLIASAGAGTNRAAAPSIDLSSRASIAKYLRTIGVDPAGVVIQRGTRNYAGPSCPGKGWSCTRATRVVQVAQRGGWNKFECTGTSNEESGDCVIVQSSPEGNTARCAMSTDGDDPISQTCTIDQTSAEGDNLAVVEQSIKQKEGSNQQGTQRATVTQQSDSGTNRSRIGQEIDQQTKDKSQVVDQRQAGSQRASVDQTSVSGKQRSRLVQSTDQDAKATKARSGSQNLSADLFATVDQHSAGVSRNRNRQDEDQDATAPKDSAVSQTLIGPIYCCSDQGTSPDDRFRVNQTSTQKSSSQSAVLSENIRAFCTTTGNCEVNQVVNQNGTRTTNTCSSPACQIGITCVENECFPCEGPDCRPPCTDCRVAEAAFRDSPRLPARQRR